MKFLIWLLNLFGFKAVSAALRAYLAESQKEAQTEAEAASTAAIEVQQGIITQAQEHIDEIPNKTDDELTDDAVALGLVSDDPEPNDSGSTPSR